MKHLSMLFALLLCLILSPGAQAASNEAEQAAESLHELGLFLGTGTNADGTPIYDLDRIPTRNQAVIMLVRLLGKEDEARSGEWEIPFNDVDAGSYMASYIGYAYANGLTKGTTDTTYSGSRLITRNQYLLFLMRAMGYASNQFYYGDIAMSTSDAAAVAEELGLIDTDNGQFTRGDIAAISNRALDAYMCDLNPNVKTLREALGFGETEKMKNKAAAIMVDKFGSYQEADATIQRDKDYTFIKQEIPVSNGMVIYYQFDSPSGPISNLVHICNDGTKVTLPLPWLNRNGKSANPENLAYNKENGSITYETTIEEDLPWFRSATLRKAGRYQYCYNISTYFTSISAL